MLDLNKDGVIYNSCAVILTVVYLMFWIEHVSDTLCTPPPPPPPTNDVCLYLSPISRCFWKDSLMMRSR